MPTIKSYAVGNGDMFYIRHKSDNFTIIDCDLCDEIADEIIENLKKAGKGKGLSGFI